VTEVGVQLMTVAATGPFTSALSNWKSGLGDSIRRNESKFFSFDCAFLTLPGYPTNHFGHLGRGERRGEGRLDFMAFLGK
jgi:hypothetical protein